MIDLAAMHGEQLHGHPTIRTGVAFDYRAAAKSKNIPAEVLQSLEDEVARDFPNDPMLMELHVLRAINAYEV